MNADDAVTLLEDEIGRAWLRDAWVLRARMDEVRRRIAEDRLHVRERPL
jgi:hypothetical protein